MQKLAAYFMDEDPMQKTALSNPFFVPYRWLWRAALPFLHRNARLADGWEERLAPENWLEPDFPPDHEGRRVDIWLQAASGGEARLAESICRNLDASLPVRLLITTWTRQGRNVIENFLPLLRESHPHLRAAARFAPLDSPDYVRKALACARPRLTALLETELWPGLMAACKDLSIPVIVLNGRINKPTMRFGKFFPKLVKSISPGSVLAVSQKDSQRFEAMFSCPARIVQNIKFDLSLKNLDAPLPDHVLAPCFDGPVFLFASVRSGEIKRLPRYWNLITQAIPDAVIIAAPRHMHSVKEWKSLAEDLAWRPVLASSLAQVGKLPHGRVVIWDRFGDLPQLYALASAVFVGGTFGQGGQNFLEPLASGIVPCIGPSAENFQWALADEPAPSLEKAGLLHQIKTPMEAIQFMLTYANQKINRDDIRMRYRAWLALRTGGSAECARQMMDMIDMP